MDALTTSTELKKWVAEGNLSAACLALQKFADETNYTELQQIAIQLQRRYNTCQQQIMQGVIAKSDADLEMPASAKYYWYVAIILHHLPITNYLI
jgi:hypothetical protein